MHLHYLLHERITKKSRYHGHAVALAFAVTDYKLQGQTKDKLILSIALRLFPPHLDLKSFYVDVSRVHTKNNIARAQAASQQIWWVGLPLRSATYKGARRVEPRVLHPWKMDVCVSHFTSQASRSGHSTQNTENLHKCHKRNK